MSVPSGTGPPGRPPLRAAQYQETPIQFLDNRALAPFQRLTLPAKPLEAPRQPTVTVEALSVATGAQVARFFR